jgi:uncharacterized protein
MKVLAQPFRVFLLLFLSVLFAQSVCSQTTVNGEWHGGFSVMGQSFLMDLVVDVNKPEVFLINPEVAGKPQIPCQEVVWGAPQLSFSWPAGRLFFKGTYHEQGDSLSGTMSQSGLEWKVSFKRELQVKKVVLRPQKPSEPYPYETKELSFQNTVDGKQIFGTFTYPVTKNSDYPIVIFASGSGPQDRDCNIMGHQPFLFLADQLAKAGIASFRFDDRGTGKSQANYSEADLTDFGNDVASSLTYIAKQKEFKGHKIGLLGHSEGGMHILLAQQAQAKKVSFLVFLAACGVSGKEVLVQQQYDIPLRSGLGDTVATWNKQLFQGMSERVLAEPDPIKCGYNLTVFLKEMYAKAPVGALSEETTEQSFIANNSFFLNNPWGRAFLAFQPATYIKKSKVPMLFVFGSEDIQVNPELNSKGFEQALTAKQRSMATFTIIPGLNHLLQTCKTCTVDEYGDLTETMSPKVVEVLIPFLKKQ